MVRFFLGQRYRSKRVSPHRYQLKRVNTKKMKKELTFDEFISVNLKNFSLNFLV